MLEQLAVLLVFLWGPPVKHRAVYDLIIIIDAVKEVYAWLRAQARHQPMMLVVLVQLIQT